MASSTVIRRLGPYVAAPLPTGMNLNWSCWESKLKVEFSYALPGLSQEAVALWRKGPERFLTSPKASRTFFHQRKPGIRADFL